MFMAKVVILCEKDFQDLELFYPLLRLKEAGHDVIVAGTGEKSYRGKNGYPLSAVDANIQQLNAKGFDAVVIPGGWAPDHLRKNAAVLKFVNAMNDDKKPIAAICHAGWVLCSIPGLLK